MFFAPVVATFLAICLFATPVAVLAITNGNLPSTPLSWEELLVNGLVASGNARNTYTQAYPPIVTWAGIDGATTYSNVSDCSSLLSLVMKRSYGITDTAMVAWLGAKWPGPKAYHDAIVAGAHFTRITAISQMQPGDVLAIKGLSAGYSSHVAVIVRAPMPVIATKPFIAETTQYQILVDDSTSNYHYIQDTRYVASPDTSFTGAGRGMMRLYADTNGNLVGFTWSMSNGSTYYTNGGALKDIVVGRYAP